MVEWSWAISPCPNALKIMHLRPYAHRAFNALLAIACFLAVANCFGADTNTYLRMHFQTNSAGETYVQYGEKLRLPLRTPHKS